MLLHQYLADFVREGEFVFSALVVQTFITSHHAMQQPLMLRVHNATFK